MLGHPERFESPTGTGVCRYCKATYDFLPMGAFDWETTVTRENGWCDYACLKASFDARRAELL